MPPNMPAHILARKPVHMLAGIKYASRFSSPAYMLIYTRQFPSQYSSQLASPYARQHAPAI